MSVLRAWGVGQEQHGGGQVCPALVSESMAAALGPAGACALSPQAHGQTFTFPDLFPEKKQSEGSTAVDEDIQDKFLEEQRERQRHDPRRGGVPNWFGL